MHVDPASAVKKKKRDHQKFVGGFALSGFVGSGRASMFPLGTLDLWVIAVDSAFIPWHFFRSLKQNFIAYRSSKVSDCIFEINQL